MFHEMDDGSFHVVVLMFHEMDDGSFHVVVLMFRDGQWKFSCCRVNVQ